MKNKPFIFLSVILFGIIVSYVVFSWSEPTGNMPTNYKPPLNTSANAQDVDPNKPVIGNLNVEKLGGYTASDLLGLIGGPASYEIVEGTACPTGTILTSKYYGQNTCNHNEMTCTQMKDANGNPLEGCKMGIRTITLTVGPGWALDPSFAKRTIIPELEYCRAAYTTNSGIFYCDQEPRYSGQYTATCQAPVTHVLCLVINNPE